MFPFSQPVSPFVRSHLDSQAAFFSELSKSMTNSFHNVFQANLQLSQSMFQETLSASQRMLTPNETAHVPETHASQTQPSSDTFRAYQQHLSRLVADSHVDLTRITQQHVQETARTAQALSEEVSRGAAEEIGRKVRRHEESAKAFRDAFEAEAASRDNQDAQRMPATHGGGVNLQSDGQGGRSSFPGNAQGPSPQPTQQANRKQPGKPG